MKTKMAVKKKGAKPQLKRKMVADQSNAVKVFEQMDKPHDKLESTNFKTSFGMVVMDEENNPKYALVSGFCRDPFVDDRHMFVQEYKVKKRESPYGNVEYLVVMTLNKEPEINKKFAEDLIKRWNDPNLNNLTKEGALKVLQEYAKMKNNEELHKYREKNNSYLEYENSLGQCSDTKDLNDEFSFTLWPETKEPFTKDEREENKRLASLLGL